MPQYRISICTPHGKSNRLGQVELRKATTSGGSRKTAGMGVSTLHHHFRALTSMSPLQYQKHLRLLTARARMLADGQDAASAAFEVGYESASQFNREYSRFFGQPPMRDIRTLRAPGDLPVEAVGNRQSVI